MARNDQTLPTIKTWLDFALQQVAAESYLDGIVLTERTQVVPRLGRGNSPLLGPDDQYIRMTPSQANAFFDRYEIIDHHPNDWTGFSATLLKDTETGQYTLAFRSLEYKNRAEGGDLERDGKLGAAGEINEKGFAFAQLAAMEDYYQKLASDPTKLQGKGPINVTGYSLGAHLVLVFTELHPTEVLQAQVFNAAGRGRILSAGNEVENIRQMLTYYRSVLFNPDNADPSLRP